MRFEDLVRAHGPDLYRYAFWLARDRSRAEDIVQEALLRGWRAYPRNSARREPESLEGLDLADGRFADPGLEMREALLALPESYAEPLALQVLGGFSCAEIAAMLGTTEGATMTRLTRARQALKRLVAPAREPKRGQP